MKAKRGFTIELQDRRIEALKEQLSLVKKEIAKNWSNKELTKKKYTIIKEINRLNLNKKKPNLKTEKLPEEDTFDFGSFI